MTYIVILMSFQTFASINYGSNYENSGNCAMYACASELS